MENFIKQHRKLSVTLFIVTVILVGIFTYSLFSNTNNNTAPIIDKDTQTGDSDSGSIIQYQNLLYSITGDQNDPSKLTIVAFSGYRNAAVDKIYQLGLSPTNFKINFNYESPFKRYE